MTTPCEPILTVGHSTLVVDDFVCLLRTHRVTAVADVRSQPHSRMNPQFNREPLRNLLVRTDIKYVFLGKELGARASDPTLYADGAVSYQRLGDSPLFQEGLRRVLEGAKNFRVALMCAERDPLTCHRAILVGRRLHAIGASVTHVLSATVVESQKQMESRLLELFKVAEDDMFQSRDELVAKAYTLQEKRIAYRPAEDGSAVDSSDESARAFTK